MGYSLDEIMILFMTYSVIGYLITTIYNSRHGKKNVRAGVAIGPFVISYGIAAILMIFILDIIGKDLLKVFIAGAITGTIIEVVSGRINQTISGSISSFYRISHTLIWGILAVVSIYHWNNIIIGISRYINPWINLIVLLVLYYILIIGFIDGISLLYDERRKVI